MTEPIPVALKAAYTKQKATEKTVTKERAKSVTIRTKLAEQNEIVATAHDLFIVARQDVRTLERQYNIGEWAPSDIPPLIVGRQDLDGNPIPK